MEKYIFLLIICGCALHSGMLYNPEIIEFLSFVNTANRKRGGKKSKSNTAPYHCQWNQQFSSAWIEEVRYQSTDRQIRELIETSLIRTSNDSTVVSFAHLNFARQSRQVKGELELRVCELAAGGARAV